MSFGNLYTENYNRSFILGIGLNIIYVIIESFYGIYINSSALLADAGHNASDVISLIIAWGAICLAKLKPFGNYTYGLRKTTILSATINGILIVAAAGFILWEAIKKIKNPTEIPENTLIMVAGAGIIINTFTAVLFIKGKQSDLNIKGTFLHMAADAAVSAGVLTGGLIMKKTSAFWIDPALSFLIVIVILWSALGLLMDSFKLSVDAVPDHIDLEKVRRFLKSQKGVDEIHDLHIWALSTTESALTAHIAMSEQCDSIFLKKIREELKQKFNIEYSTLELENHISRVNETNLYEI